MIAQEIETHRVHTFSDKEMAFNILGLMHQILFGITYNTWIIVDPYIEPGCKVRFC
ncbi:hypothetical protein V8E52_007084 [Russula decolorans]